jgi:hypothetical protein
MRGAEEVTLGGDGGAIQAEIYTNHDRAFLYNGLRNRHHDMQPILALAVHEVCCSNGIACVVRNGERNNRTSIDGRKVHRLCCPIEAISSLIIANRTEPTLRAFDWFELRLRLASLLGFGYFLG